MQHEISQEGVDMRATWLSGLGQKLAWNNTSVSMYFLEFCIFGDCGRYLPISNAPISSLAAPVQNEQRTVLCSTSVKYRSGAKY
jgi:hypothetical protein